jgi:formylglycine-generating enzyme required for sulfatase activity
MKEKKSLLAWMTSLFVAASGVGQDVVITSMQGNGRMAWTNALNPNAIYRVEWASQLSGPWRSFTYQPINTIDAHGSTSFEVEVPMFYRVVMTTNPPPVGMVWIDGGDSERGQAGIAEPVHTNFISGFWIDAREVTKGLWDEVANWAATNGYDISASSGLGKAINHPITEVSWYECVKWCNARSEKEGLTPCYYVSGTTSVYRTGWFDIQNDWVRWDAGGYRLPTEAEWEKAARGGRQRKLFPWGGDTIHHGRANYYALTNFYSFDINPVQGYHPNFTNGLPYTSAVGSFPANGYGLYDVAGNVVEWCWDRYGTYSAVYATDPRGPNSGNDRIQRGGSWTYDAAFALVAYRHFTAPDEEYAFIGFRCVRGP